MLNSKFLTIPLTLAAVFFLAVIARDYPKKAEVEQRVFDLKGQIEAAKKEEERVRSLSEYLKSESYLEKQARLRLNLKKEGEEVVFVYQKDEGEVQNQSKQNENPILKKFKGWFKFLSE